MVGRFSFNNENKNISHHHNKIEKNLTWSRLQYVIEDLLPISKKKLCKAHLSIEAIFVHISIRFIFCFWRFINQSLIRKPGADITPMININFCFQSFCRPKEINQILYDYVAFLFNFCGSFTCVRVKIWN